MSPPLPLPSRREVPLAAAIDVTMTAEASRPSTSAIAARTALEKFVLAASAGEKGSPTKTIVTTTTTMGVCTEVPGVPTAETEAEAITKGRGSEE